MSRTTARKHAFILTFQTEFHANDLYEEIINQYLSPFENMSSNDKIFIENEFYGIIKNKNHIDEIIDKYASGWAINRISKVDLAILRLSVYEIIYSSDVPDKVSVNEAVELAKLFGGDDSSSFINGILRNVLKEKELII